MPTEIGRGPRTFSGNSIGLVFPILVVLSVLVLIAPVPPVILDLLLAANITGSVLILLTTISVRRPLEFSAFPSLLLVATLVRLVLNVASTRLILTRAPLDGTVAAGAVIEAFGQFVAGGQLAVGLILFSIVVVIQFVVVTKGSTRISEVAARFALDGMPGKQMAIDADLAAGHITPEQARIRRLEVTDLADFHAAMDGAGKFVRGDAVASVLIAIINLIGGIAIGMIQHHMSPMKAIEVFATLTIGDGLVSQIPGFLISIAAGLLATRSSREANISQDVVHQTFRSPTTLFLAAAFVGGLAFTGLPMLPLLALGVGCAYIGMTLSKQLRIDLAIQTSDKSETAPALPVHACAAGEHRSRQPRPEEKLAIEPIELELGFRLIKLADPEADGDLMDRVTQLRNRVAQELGIILPKVKIRDSLRLKDFGYQIRLRGIPVAAGEIRMDSVLAIDAGNVSGDLAGIDFVEPATGRPAKWIEPIRAEHARMLGYKIVEPASVLISHLADIVKSHADELLTRQQVHQLIDNLKTTCPKVVEELIPELLRPAHVQQILCNLLRERIPIRDLETILQTLGDFADRSKDLTVLTEHVRQSLDRTICQQYRDVAGSLRAITLDPALEEVLARGCESGEWGLRVKLAPEAIDGLIFELTRQSNKFVRAGYPAVVVCASSVRPLLKQITRTSLPKLAVLSLEEMTRETNVLPQCQIPVHVIKLPNKRVTEELLMSAVA